MAGDSGSSIPYTAISVVVLFLTTTYLGQHGFEAWRPTDTDTSKRLQLAEPPVEARLWEDPLSALDRHRVKLKEPCSTDSKAAAGSAPVTRAPAAADRGTDPACLIGQPLDAAKFRGLFSKGDSVTLIAAMLPGAALVGAEEARRRTRYAVLAGLNAAGFVPSDSERMGLLRVPRCESFAGCAQDEPGAGDSTRMDIVYETLSAPGPRYAVVLWIDDTTIGRRWLSAITLLLTDLTPATSANVQLRILGPSGSDLLVRALDADLTEMANDVHKANLTNFAAKWRTLVKLRLISPQSTAPAEQLRSAAHLTPYCFQFEGDCIDRSFEARLGEVAARFAWAVGDAPLGLRELQRPLFVRMVGTDDLLTERLLAELRGRGLCSTGPRKRVILIGEWDSIYARTFSETLQGGLKCPDEEGEIDLQSYSYLRGLDGVTIGDSTSQTRRSGDSNRGDAKAPIEWPEGRPQSDYVRRLVQEILKDNADRPVHAVGMIGSDVHDKLVLVQALRDAFPDRVLFTTDMDARLLHPSVMRYMRNVIVASSLPLAWNEEAESSAALRSRQPANRIGPFRDTYQTATFLAARLAVVADNISDCSKPEHAENLECRVAEATATPRVFEIARDGMVELPLKGVSDSEKGRRVLAAKVVFAVFLVLTGLMVVGYPGPAMRHARLWWSNAPQEPFGPSYAVVAGLEVAALAYAAAVVAELAAPGIAGAWGPPLSSAAAAMFFWTSVYPGTPWVQALRPGVKQADSGAAWACFVGQLCLVVVVALVPWALLESAAARNPDADMREPFAVLSGVSAWPSQLLRTLVVVLFAWFLDEIWCRSAEAVGAIEKKYRLSSAGAPAAGTPPGWPTRIWQGLKVWFFWRPDVLLPGGRVDGAKLWREYRLLMDNGTRALRVVVWSVLAMALIFASAWLINHLTGDVPSEIPARGFTDRGLFWGTVIVSAGAIIVLLVMVGDVTILTSRFVAMLKRGRTVYPPETIARFAAELGPQRQAQACTLLAASPNQRSDGSAPQPDRNSLLDDWIDARLLAEHTAAIGRLIVFPFILVALLVVARSQLLDNWYIGGAVLVGLVVYVLWAIAMAALLNYDAEQARQKALRGMEADLRWLKGAGPDLDKFTDGFPDLIEQVRKLREGAFAPFFEQSLVQAILVPLGGAGGVQLISLLMYARAQ